MSTGETYTEHVQLLCDTTLVGRYKNCTMVLICDSARSHVMASFRKWCYYNDVTLLYVPAHGTSLLQPLDLSSHIALGCASVTFSAHSRAA